MHSTDNTTNGRNTALPQAEAHEPNNQKECPENWLPLSKSAILTGLSILITTGIQWGFAIYKADEWGKDLRYYPTIQLSASPESDVHPLDAYLENYPEAPTAQKNRLKEQLEVVRSRARTHIRATRDLYVWSSVTITLASLTTVITGLCLLHITRRGWDHSNPRIVGIFIVTAGTSILCGSLLVIYQYDVNIQTNAGLYIRHVNLEEAMLTMLATQSMYDIASQEAGQPAQEQLAKANQPQKVTLAEIIKQNHQLLNQYHTVSLELNLESIPSVDEILEDQRIPE